MAGTFIIVCSTLLIGPNGAAASGKFLLPHSTSLGPMRDRTADGINGVVGDEQVDVRSVRPKGVVAGTIELLAPLPLARLIRRAAVGEAAWGLAPHRSMQWV